MLRIFVHQFGRHKIWLSRQNTLITEEAVVESDIILRVGFRNVQWNKRGSILVKVFDLWNESITLELFVDSCGNDLLAVVLVLSVDAHFVQA